MQIGVLSLQGAVAPHLQKLQSLGVSARSVRNPVELNACDALILPGGESTAMIHLAKLNGTWEELKKFSLVKPTWGICAGAILLANEVAQPQQDSLAVIDIAVERNAFGRQVDSFIDQIQLKNGDTVEGFFIRAPRIRRVGDRAKVLGTWKNEPVLVEQGLAQVSTFHPELTDDMYLHQAFINKVRSGNGR